MDVTAGISEPAEAVHHTTTVQPPKIRFADQALAITRPYVVHSRADIASMMRAHRISMKLSCEQFDAEAGFPDRYVTKLENSRDHTTGGTRQGFIIRPPDPERPDDAGSITASFMAEVWLETAGVRLVLMPAELAEKIGAVPAPKRQTNPNTAKALSELAQLDGETL